MTIKGNTLATVEELDGSPAVQITSNGKRITRRFAVAWTGVAAAVAGLDKTYDGAPLVDVAYERQKDAAIITATYQPDTLGTAGGTKQIGASLDTPVYEGGNQLQQVDIRRHPDWSGSWDGSKPGVEAYLVPQPTWSILWIAEIATPPTQAQLMRNVGKRVAPPGMAGAAANAWLKTNRSMRLIGKNPDTNLDRYEVRDEYQYSGDVDGGTWDTDIYEAGTGESVGTL